MSKFGFVWNEKHHNRLKIVAMSFTVIESEATILKIGFVAVLDSASIFEASVLISKAH